MNDRPDTVNPADLIRLAGRAASFQDAAADRLGLNATDVRCLRLAESEPDVTPGRLAELSGLTSGAVTGVLDRLERAGYAERVPDPGDRRRTLVRLIAARRAELDAVYAPFDAAVTAAAATYEPGQRLAIREFLELTGATMEHEAERLRASVHGGLVAGMFTAPLGDLASARLVFESGAPRLSVRAAPLGPSTEARMVAELAHSNLGIGGEILPDELVRARFSGPVPDIRARNGVVTVRYRRRLDWRQRSAEISLSQAVPWSIEVSGGLSGLRADLRGLRLGTFDVRGGTDSLDLQLPEPDGTSRLRLTGGAKDISLRYPSGSAVRLRIRGGAHLVQFGEQRLQMVSGEMSLETRGARAKPDRYEIELTGGARNVRVAPG